MTTKKKAIIALSAVGVLAVGVIVALVAVIAAFTANTTGNFTVTYTAINVKATVTAEYFVTNNGGPENGDPGFGVEGLKNLNYITIQTTDNLDTMVFDGSEAEETTTKAFKNIGNLSIEEPQGDASNYPAIFLHYSIRNDSQTENMVLEITETFSKNEGVIVTIPEPSDFEMNYLYFLNFTASPITIAPQETYELYFRVIFTGHDSQQFDAAFNFVLSSVV